MRFVAVATLDGKRIAYSPVFFVPKIMDASTEQAVKQASLVLINLLADLGWETFKDATGEHFARSW